MVWKQRGFTPENSFFLKREIYGYLNPPMVYLQVCRYWREVALSTSSLWTSCSSEQFWPKVSVHPAMKYWLDRSSPTAPLNLQLKFQSNFPPLYANSIFRLLATEVRRWRSMSIELDLSLAREFAGLLEERTQDLSHLEELEIHLLPKDVPATISQRILAQIPLVKSLRRFTWVSNGRESRDHVFRQLRASAVLDDITIFTPSLFDEAILHLSQCVSATKVRLYDRTCHYYPLQRKPVLPMTMLPRLTFLTLTRYFDAMDILDYFTLPSLEYLKIVTKDDNGTGEGHNLSILRRFLERSKCPLRSLAIEANISDAILTDYLRFPSIRSIPEFQITDDCNNFEQRLLKILETYSNAQTTFPPIIQCWIPKTILSLPSIGWSNLSNSEKLIFSWMAGKLDDTTKYIPKEFYNCICRACYDRQES
ncbi:hypothetical protein M413DRAFT_278174 [Hebeloma cylindrosporum]|uniref:F-box domain-containing protein n=1 Tax=Hebeloma cylindrosporum TaxID=76867 RepID=A0A0C2Y8L7_HEBCY|nr:hypothetical protein M413DRAFT_278174 [Hebeloma cylindrosporum h7]